MDDQQKQKGLGVIIRDESGEIMVSIYTNISYNMKLIIAEGMALRKAMEICAELGFARVIFEGDSSYCKGDKQQRRIYHRVWIFGV